MKILGLDLSIKSGYALLENGSLTVYGVLKAEELPDYLKISDITTNYCDDFQYSYNAVLLAKNILELVTSDNPDLIYIEQINQGQNRMSQKSLDFIHSEVIRQLWHFREKIRFVDTSCWRSILKIHLNKDQIKHNKKNRDLRETGKHAKRGEGKITAKHLAVAFVNEHYALHLKLCHNDIADAICVANCGYLLETTNKINQIDLDKIIK